MPVTTYDRDMSGPVYMRAATAYPGNANASPSPVRVVSKLPPARAAAPLVKSFPSAAANLMTLVHTIPNLTAGVPPALFAAPNLPAPATPYSSLNKAVPQTFGPAPMYPDMSVQKGAATAFAMGFRPSTAGASAFNAVGAAKQSSQQTNLQQQNPSGKNGAGPLFVPGGAGDSGSSSSPPLFVPGGAGDSGAQQPDGSGDGSFVQQAGQTVAIAANNNTLLYVAAGVAVLGIGALVALRK